MATLEKGEVGAAKLTKKLEKGLIREKLSFDYENNVFLLYVEVFAIRKTMETNKTAKKSLDEMTSRQLNKLLPKCTYKILTLYFWEGVYELCNEDYTELLYSAEPNDLQEIFDFLKTVYNSKYEKGLISKRN